MIDTDVIGLQYNDERKSPGELSRVNMISSHVKITLKIAIAIAT